MTNLEYRLRPFTQRVDWGRHWSRLAHGYELCVAAIVIFLVLFRIIEVEHLAITVLGALVGGALMLIGLTFGGAPLIEFLLKYRIARRFRRLGPTLLVNEQGQLEYWMDEQRRYAIPLDKIEEIVIQTERGGVAGPRCGIGMRVAPEHVIADDAALEQIRGCHSSGGYALSYPAVWIGRKSQVDDFAQWLGSVASKAQVRELESRCNKRDATASWIFIFLFTLILMLTVMATVKL